MRSPLPLEDARLRLRDWCGDDLAPVAAINGDPDVMRYFEAPMTRAQSDAWARRKRRDAVRHGFGFWPVERRDAPGLIGVVGLQHVPDDVPFTPAIEIGWRIATAHQRHGYAEAAARLALAAAFGPLGLDSVVAFTVPANAPSRALIAKLGFVEQGRFEHPRLPHRHPYRPHLLYRLNRPPATR